MCIYIYIVCIYIYIVCIYTYTHISGYNLENCFQNTHFQKIKYTLASAKKPCRWESLNLASFVEMAPHKKKKLAETLSTWTAPLGEFFGVAAGMENGKNVVRMVDDPGVNVEVKLLHDTENHWILLIAGVLGNQSC